MLGRGGGAGVSSWSVSIQGAFIAQYASFAISQGIQGMALKYHLYMHADPSRLCAAQSPQPLLCESRVSVVEQRRRPRPKRHPYHLLELRAQWEYVYFGVRSKGTVH